MAGRALEHRTLGLLLVTALLAGGALLGSVTALPDLAPPDTTLDVGATGVEDKDAFAKTEDQLLVAPGARITLQADFSFEGTDHAPGAAYSYRAVLRVHDASGQIGQAIEHRSVTAGAPISDTGTLSVEISIPEVRRSLTVSLEATLYRSQPGSFGMVDEAKDSSVITVIALPDPVSLADGGLVVDDSLSLGTIGFTGSKREVNATDGYVHVSTDAGTRFTADVAIDRPHIPGASYIEIHITASASVRLEDGSTYNTNRVVHNTFCDDWSTHSCTSAPETRTLELEVVVPTAGLTPGSVVDTELRVEYMVNWWHGGQNIGDNDHDSRSDQGRHLVLSV